MLLLAWVLLIPPAAPAPPTFDGAVRPMLEKRCSPCHFKDGKMYERLPFDAAETLASHVPGVRKRLKGDALALYEAWLKSRNPPK